MVWLMVKLDSDVSVPFNIKELKCFLHPGKNLGVTDGIDMVEIGGLMGKGLW